MVGIDPGPFTLRELAWMSEGRQREAWNRVSALMALVANCNRDPKKHKNPFESADFNPFHRRQQRVVVQGSFKQLKEALGFGTKKKEEPR